MEGIGFVSDSIGWVGGWSSGMYQTKDGGKTWKYQDFGENLNRFFFLNAKLGYAGGSSIYRFSDSIKIYHPHDSNNEIIHSFDLFPNPAKDILKITLSLNKSTNVIFEIYYAGGKLITELMKGKMNKILIAMNLK